MTTRKTPLIASSAMLFFSDLEDFEGFLLILDARIFLPVTAQADAGFEVIHHVQVIDPLAIDDRQQQIPLLDDAHDLRRYFASPLPRTLRCALARSSRRISSRSLPAKSATFVVRLTGKIELERVEHLVEIPLARMGVLRRVLLDAPRRLSLRASAA